MVLPSNFLPELDFSVFEVKALVRRYLTQMIGPVDCSENDRLKP